MSKVFYPCQMCRKKFITLPKLVKHYVAVHQQQVTPEQLGFAKPKDPGENKDLSENKESEDPNGECVICQDAKKDCIFLGCGHLCCCLKCGDQLFRKDYPQCPLCRAEIELIQKVYF